VFTGKVFGRRENYTIYDGDGATIVSVLPSVAKGAPAQFSPTSDTNRNCLVSGYLRVATQRIFGYLFEDP